SICISDFECDALLSLERAYRPKKSRRKKNCRESVTTTCMFHGLIVHRINLKPNNAAIVKKDGCRQPQSPTAVNELRVIPRYIVIDSGEPCRSLPVAVLLLNRQKPSLRPCPLLSARSYHRVERAAARRWPA